MAIGPIKSSPHSRYLDPPSRVNKNTVDKQKRKAAKKFRNDARKANQAAVSVAIHGGSDKDYNEQRSRAKELKAAAEKLK